MLPIPSREHTTYRTGPCCSLFINSHTQNNSSSGEFHASGGSNKIETCGTFISLGSKHVQHVLLLFQIKTYDLNYIKIRKSCEISDKNKWRDALYIEMILRVAAGAAETVFQLKVKDFLDMNIKSSRGQSREACRMFNTKLSFTER